MHLRSYQQDDFEQLTLLWWNAWHSSSGYNHPKPIDVWKERWLEITKTHTIVVIEDGGKIIAFAALNFKDSLLSQIFVSPLHKRKGIGKELLRWISSQCPHGFRLKTALKNAESRAFYNALGMVEGERSINPFNGRDEIEYIYCRSYLWAKGDDLSAKSQQPQPRDFP